MRHLENIGSIGNVPFFLGGELDELVFRGLNKLIKTFNGCLPAGCFFPGRIV